MENRTAKRKSDPTANKRASKSSRSSSLMGSNSNHSTTTRTRRKTKTIVMTSSSSSSVSPSPSSQAEKPEVPSVVEEEEEEQRQQQQEEVQEEEQVEEQDDGEGGGDLDEEEKEEGERNSEYDESDESNYDESDDRNAGGNGGGGGGGMFDQYLPTLMDDSDSSSALVGLTELCEVLSLSEEETISRHDSESLAPILVTLAKREENPDVMLFAIRAITYLCDAYPRSYDFFVQHDVVSVVCARLMAIEYVDVAEQCIQALEKISENRPHECLQGGAIMAVLCYIDFFSLTVQRVAVATVTNICMELSPDCSPHFMDAVPLLCNLLEYEDQKLLGNVVICLRNIAEQACHSSELLDELCERKLIHQVTHRLAASNGTTLSPPIYTNLIRLLSSLASHSVRAGKILIELNISSTLKHSLSNYDHSHVNPYSLVSGQMHEVLKLLNAFLPPLALNSGDNSLVSEKEAFFVNHQPELLQQFGIDILPVLIQVVNSGANLYACYGCLSVINKILCLSRSDMLPDLLNKTNISSFLAGIFARKDHHVQVLALNIVKTLLQELPNAYLNSFVKEGVVYAIDAILTPEKCSQFMSPACSTSSNQEVAVDDVLGCLCYAYDVDKSPSPGTRTCKVEKTSVHVLAEHIKTAYLTPESGYTELGLTKVVQKLKTLCSELSGMVDASMKGDTCAEQEKNMSNILGQIMAELNGGESLSTFEFIESGIVKCLVYYLSNAQYQNGKMDLQGLSNHLHVTLKRFEVFGRFSLSSSSKHWEDTPVATLIRILQSAISSLENFPVILNHAFRPERTDVTIASKNFTEGPCLNVSFMAEEGETTLCDYDSDVETLDAFTSLDVIESFLWPKVSTTNEEDGQLQTSCCDGVSQKLVFYLDGTPLDREMSLYQAILQLRVKAEKDMILGPKFWNEAYKITYRKAPDLQSNTQDSPHESQFSTMRENPRAIWKNVLCTLFVEPPHKLNSSPIFETLVLLKILQVLNKYAVHLIPERSNPSVEERNSDVDNLEVTVCRVPEAEFVSIKLTEKLEQQMQDPLALSANSMPAWCGQLMATFPFLFSFDARSKYFRLTMFGSLQVQPHSRTESASNASNDRESHGSSLPRPKFLVFRDRILDSATKLMDKHASTKATLEVEYEEEVGTGLGPTIEFYTLVSRELQKVGLGMWRADPVLSPVKGIEDKNSVYVASAFGLFPCPWSVASSASNGILFSDVIKKFTLLGQVVARALKDGRILDLPLSKSFYKLMLEQELHLNDIQSFDPELGRVLIEFQNLVDKKVLELVSGKSTMSLTSSYFQNTRIEDLCLDFTLPGYPDYMLTSVDDHKMVNMSNLEEYVSLTVDATLNSGIFRQIEAFKSGFNQVLPIKSLRIFTEEELERLLCGERKAWTAYELLDHIKFDHGYTARSSPIVHFLDIMQEFECHQQQAFLQFVTGAPRLPLGGLAALEPKMTVVCKNCSDRPDSDLPSVMTCVHYLKLPPYSSKEVMKEKLLLAITEGQGSFHMS